MKCVQKPYTGTQDQSRMMALAAQTAHDNLHGIDLPYRFSSWAFDTAENMALWEDERGELMGWAVLQTPFWAMDYVLHPSAMQQGLHPLMLAWADQRAQQVIGSETGHPCWFINVFTEQRERMGDLEKLGFACQSDVGENSWSKVWMARQAHDALPVAPLPDGFSIRPLAHNEVEAYVALHQAVFESKSMTVAWRTRTRQQPDYRAELDLVVQSPTGELAAFCVGWLAEPGGQIEPMGVHKDFRSKGLGKALLREGVRRLHQLGAAQVFVETDNYRDAAFALYESVGFRVAKDVLVYRKDYS